MKIWVSPASPPRTKRRPSSATVVVPGRVCNAPTKSPNALAVVTISKGFKTEILLLSPAEKEPAEIVTVSREFTSSRSVIFKPFIFETSSMIFEASKET